MSSGGRPGPLIVNMNRTSRDLADLFPYRVCINLDRRPEKWARMQARFLECNLQPVERFAAVDGANVQIPAKWPESPGAYGCLQSHLAVVSSARAQGRKNVLIIEDDVLFDSQFTQKFRDRSQNLPGNWDMLFFGCLHHDRPIPMGSGIAKLRGSFSTFMYAIRHTVYDAFIRLNFRAKQAVDRNNTILQRLFNCYCFVPHLAWVDDSYSDTQGVHTSHWYIKQSMVLGGAEVKTMEKRTTMVIRYCPGTERSFRNLRYLASYYSALFNLFIVERGEHPTIERADFPANCSYCFVRQEENGAAFEMLRCLLASRERCELTSEYIIFNESDIVCSRMELRANLLKCLEHDLVSSFQTYIDLNDSDSDRLIRGLIVNTEAYTSRPRRGRFNDYFTISRSALRTLLETAPVRRGEVKLEDLHGLRIFDSPGQALRLWPGELVAG